MVKPHIDAKFVNMWLTMIWLKMYCMMDLVIIPPIPVRG
jgi:hypothetical protein